MRACGNSRCGRSQKSSAFRTLRSRRPAERRRSRFPAEDTGLGRPQARRSGQAPWRDGILPFEGNSIGPLPLTETMRRTQKVPAMLAPSRVLRGAAAASCHPFSRSGIFGLSHAPSSPYRKTRWANSTPSSGSLTAATCARSMSMIGNASRPPSNFSAPASSEANAVSMSRASPASIACLPSWRPSGFDVRAERDRGCSAPSERPRRVSPRRALLG